MNVFLINVSVCVRKDFVTIWFLVFKNNGIHLVYNDNGSNSIKYVRGSFNNTSYIYEHQNKQELFYNFDLLGRKTKKPSFILKR